jgi:hypothetical protein
MRLASRVVAVVALAGTGLVPAAAARAGAVPDPGRVSTARGVVTAQAAAPVISTVAGGVGGPGPGPDVAMYSEPPRYSSGYKYCGVLYEDTGNVSYAAGHLYLADGPVVRAVDTTTGVLTTPAGSGGLVLWHGLLGNHRLATNASLDACDVTVDNQGNLVIAGQKLIRVVAASTGTFYGQAMTAGHIYNVAGTGNLGDSGDGGPATQASIWLAAGVAVDSAGNILIADSLSNAIRVVAASTGTFYGQAMTAGDIYTVAGDNPGPYQGGYSGDGGPATRAELNTPQAVALDSAGNILIADSWNNVIRVVAESTGTFYGQAMTAGDIYTVAGDGNGGSSGDGGPALSAELHVPGSVAVDAAGNLIIADTSTRRVRVVAESTGTFYGQAMTAGDIYNLAGNGGTTYRGDGGLATDAALSVPSGVTVDGAGNVAIWDSGHLRLRVVAASTGTFYGQAMTAGHIYTVAGNGTTTDANDGGLPTSAQISPAGLATDAGGDLAFADSVNNRVHLVPATTGRMFGQAMTAGHIYTVAGDGTSGYSGDGGPADRAELSSPSSVTFDRTGNLVIADTGNGAIRVVAYRTGTFYGQAMTAGDIYTVATGVAAADVAVSQAGNILIANTNSLVVQVLAATTGNFYDKAMIAGHIYTVAGDGSGGSPGDGGRATQGHLDPTTVTTDHAGNLVISDILWNRIRVVANTTGTFYGQAMTANDIYTVAGSGPGGGYSGDGGPATLAELNGPSVAVDGAGNLVIGDSNNQVIRVVAASTGTFYGQAMTAGDIYTISGNSQYAGFNGDGLAAAALLAYPGDVAVTPAGNVLISDTGNNRIREITP